MNQKGIVSGVFIRDTKAMVNKIGREWSRIETALIKAGREGIPVYYQELQPKDPKSHKFKKEDIIGSATNVRVDSNGHLVCDVRLNPFNDLTSHFTGVIDNYGIMVNSLKGRDGQPSKLTYKVNHFIVYDKNRKAEVDKHVRKTNSGKKK